MNRLRNKGTGTLTESQPKVGGPGAEQPPSERIDVYSSPFGTRGFIQDAGSDDGTSLAPVSAGGSLRTAVPQQRAAGGVFESNRALSL